MTLVEFIHAELELYERDGGSQLYAAAARAIRCEQYVEEIVRRYTAAARLHSQMIQDMMNSVLDAERPRLVDQQSMLVHLEIESFYVFAKILLYRMARLLHWSFTSARFAHGISITRHHTLVENLGRLIEVGQLSAPADIVSLAQEVQTRIVDYRDKQVEHDDAHTMAMTYFTLDGHAQIGKYRPGAGIPTLGSTRSEHLDVLHDLQRRYVDRATQLLALNRDKTRLHSLLCAHRPETR